MRLFIAYCGGTSCENPLFTVQSREVQGERDRTISLNFLREGLSVEIEQKEAKLARQVCL